MVTRPARIVAPMPMDRSAISIRERRRSSDAVTMRRNILLFVIILPPSMPAVQHFRRPQTQHLADGGQAARDSDQGDEARHNGRDLGIHVDG